MIADEAVPENVNKGINNKPINNKPKNTKVLERKEIVKNTEKPKGTETSETVLELPKGTAGVETVTKPPKLVFTSSKIKLRHLQKIRIRRHLQICHL